MATGLPDHKLKESVPAPPAPFRSTTGGWLIMTVLGAPCGSTAVTRIAWLVMPARSVSGTKPRRVDASLGNQVCPPSSEISVKTSKKLSMWYIRSPISVIVVCPVDGSVGLSRIITPPPLKSIDNNSVLNDPVVRFHLPNNATTAGPFADNGWEGPPSIETMASIDAANESISLLGRPRFLKKGSSSEGFSLTVPNTTVRPGR